MTNIIEFFETNLKTEAKWIFFESALEAHEIEILRQILKQQKRGLSQFELRSEGPSADLEASFLSLDFFSPAKVFYLHLKAAPSKWDALATQRWQKILELSDSAGNWLFLSADDSKNLEKQAPLTVRNSSMSNAPEAWTNFLNRFLDGGLDKSRLTFMAGLVPDSYLDFLHWIELWKLGGDDWAKHALGWGETRRSPSDQNFGRNPAYDWVDSALAGSRERFLKLSYDLLDRQGEDPLRLWGLLGKSIKISAQIAMGENIAGEAPFLVSKLKRVKYRPELLDWWCKCDVAMKTSRADVLGLWGQIPVE